MNEQGKIQQQIAEKMVGGDYNDNLSLAMQYSASAVSETSTNKEQYLLSQASVQAQIATALLLEEIAGRLTEMIEPVYRQKD